VIGQSIVAIFFSTLRTRRVALVIATLSTVISGAVWSQSPATGDVAKPIDEQLRAVLLQAVNNADSFDDRFDAEVWLSDMSQRLARQVRDLDERLHILRTVHQNATKLDIAPELVLAIIEVESNFDRFAISSSSALGLMQVMPFWVKELGGSSQSELFDVEYNILLGCQILKYYLDMEDGELVPALGRYNGSLGRRTYPDRVIDALRSRWFRA
jgi:soluble lytic murein transglycosylase-like protein